MKSGIVVFIAVVSLVIFASMPLAAQEKSIFDSQGEPSLQLPKTDFGLQVGSSFTTGFGGGSLFTQSVAPHFQWNPTQRFSLVVGSVFSSGQLSGVSGLSPFALSMASSGNMLQPQGLFSATVYAMGAYQASPRLTVFGGGWTERNNMQAMQPQMNPQAFNLNPRGMMMGFDYRISERFSFGAQVNVSQGYNPFNPFFNQGGFHRSTFPSSPFHRNPLW